MDNYFKSPMNYLGNKYKLLSSIIPLLPKNINNFYDVFCGGLDVSLNIKARKVISNDANTDLIWLYNEIKNYNNNIGDELLLLDKKYFPMNEFNGKAIRTYSSTDKELFNELFTKKKDIFYSLREDFNTGKQKNFLILMLLMMNSFGVTEFRVVNKKTTFSCGKMRITENTKTQVNEFKKRLDGIHITNKDFRYINEIRFNTGDFVYLDPPYLDTSQYKNKWSEKDEIDLYGILDNLHKRDVKFALSNFADNEAHKNKYLREWSKKYNIHNMNDTHLKLHGLRKIGKNSQNEILVTNY